MSRIFLAGAAGVIGRRLTPLLLAHGHSVWIRPEGRKPSPATPASVTKERATSSPRPLRLARIE